MKLKELMNEYIKAEEASTEAEKAYDLDFENEELEESFDKAYAEEFKAFEAVVDEIVAITNGLIDKPTACALVRMKKDTVVDLVTRMA